MSGAHTHPDVEERLSRLQAHCAALESRCDGLDATIRQVDWSSLDTAEGAYTRLALLEQRPQLRNLFTPRDPQAAIQSALDRDGYAYLAPGRYRINKKLTVPRRYGCGLIGLGGSTAYVRSNPIHPKLYSDGAAILEWEGGPTDAVIEVLGAEARLDGLNIIGGDQTERGILVQNGHRSEHAVRGGKLNIGSLTGANLETLIQFGVDGGGDNADVTTVGRLTAYDCKTIVRVAGNLSFELHFGYVRNARCDTVFDCQAGGGLHCGGGQTLERGGTVLRLGAVNPTASRYTIRGWHVDAPAAASGFKILECVDRSWADVTAEVFLPQLPYPTPIAKMIGPVSLRLPGCSNLRPESIHGIAHAAGTPVVIADGCRLRGVWRGKNLLTGAGTERLRDCFDESGTML